MGEEIFGPILPVLTFETFDQVAQGLKGKAKPLAAYLFSSDKENIERIYGDAYLDITDLTKLPIKLAGIIKQFIRF